MARFVFRALLTLSLLGLAVCEDGIIIAVPRAAVTGTCCEECPNATASTGESSSFCVSQYPLTQTDPCTVAACEYDASLAVDGNVSTAVSLEASDPSATQAGVVASLTLDLGILYEVREVQLQTDLAGLLWTLSLSLGGDEFESILNSSSEGLVETFNLTSLSSGVQPAATHVRLARSPGDAQSATRIHEVIVFGVELGCGACVEQLLEALRVLRELINSGFTSPPEQVDELRVNITDLQSIISHLEGTLLVLDVVLGRRGELSVDVDLPMSVARLDLLLTPPIPRKLDDLQSILNDISEIPLDTQELGLQLSDLDDDVSLLWNKTQAFDVQVKAFEDQLNETITHLSNNFTTLISAISEVNSTLATITSRDYFMLMSELDSYQSVSSSVFSQVQSLFADAERAMMSATTVRDRFREVAEPLMAARDVAVETSDTAADALTTGDRAEELLNLVWSLVEDAQLINTTIDLSLSDVESLISRAELILAETNNLTVTSLTLSSILTDLVSTLQQTVANFSLSLSPYRPPESCDPNSTPCTSGQIHADSLGQNSSYIVNSTESVVTLSYARDFLTNLRESGQILDFSDLNQTALRAQMLSQDAISQLAMVNISSLMAQSTIILEAAETLSGRAPSILQTAQDINSTAINSLGRLYTLQSTLDDLRPQLPLIVNRTSELSSQAGLQDEAMQTLTLAQTARNKTIGTNERVSSLETEIPRLAAVVNETAVNVQLAEEAIGDAEGNFFSISTFLNTTRVTSETFVVNVTEFIAVNEQIISEIDRLIAGLADIHSRINRINSPIQLQDSDDKRSYISLQSPPGRSIKDQIQFETLDLYVWTGPGFRSPALLFYAGPTYFEGIDDIRDGENRTEDYFILTVEDDDVHLRWQMGGAEGVGTIPVFKQGFSQIFISRVGSEFQLRFGVSVGELDSIATMGMSSNNSLLFKTSNRTSFFLGGWPEGSQLGAPSSIVPLSSLNSFQGQVQLLMFNGEQWGLWNVRGSSDTMFIGSFFRNELAIQNTWNGPRDISSSSATISFNGRGYLRVEQLGNVVNFNVGMRTFTVINRPVDETDGLVFYAFDPQLQVSMEVAYQSGSLRLIVRRRDSDDPLVDYEQTITPNIVATAGQSGRQIEIRVFDGVGFQVNGQNFLSRGNTKFFTDLTKVVAWYGGVRSDLLESPFVPEISNSSFYGCVDVFVEGRFARNILRGSHYVDYYLNSPVQQGFSGTCLQSIYTRSVGFSGEAFLSYPHVELVRVANSPITLVGGASPGVNTLSVSFFLEANSGVLLGAVDGDQRLYAVIRSGVLVVGVSGDGVGHVTQESEISVGVWHYLLIEVGPNQFTSYLDGTSQGPAVVMQGLNFQLRTTPDVADSASVLFVGGVSVGVVPEIDDLPSFTGCMSDFVYNFGAMSFLNPSLTSKESRYPVGVVYNSCPFFDVPLDPLLAVGPDPIEPQLCLTTPPVDLVNTHGGFHRKTRLRTSNVIGLFERSWELSMLLKQIGDGHVISITSTQGHLISLVIRDGIPILTLSEAMESPSMGGVTESSGGVVLPANVFTAISIQCSISFSQLSCALLINNITSGQPLLAVYNGSTFYPELPLVLGETEDIQGQVVSSFVGCVSSLATSGDTSGFVNLHTDIPCYNNSESGLGFTGISQLSTALPTLNETRLSVEISMTFRPLQQNGLLLLVTTTNQTEPVFTAGMFNGELRVSNFNLSSGYLSFSEPSTICNSTRPVFYTLHLVYNASSLVVGVAEEGRARESQLELVTPLSIPSLTGLDLSLTVGDTPTGYTVTEGSAQFLFLLSEDVSADSLPPGLVGCVTHINMDGEEVGLENANSADHILVGLCPAEG